jgi:hypothetical protein
MNQTSDAGQPATGELSTGELVKQAAEQVSALAGNSRMKRATPPLPSEAVQSVKTDVEEIRERVRG